MGRGPSKINETVVSLELQNAWAECVFQVCGRVDSTFDTFAENCGMSENQLRKYLVCEKRLPKLYFLGTMQCLRWMISDWNYDDDYFDEVAQTKHRVKVTWNECWSKFKEEVKLDTTTLHSMFH